MPECSSVFRDPKKDLGRDARGWNDYEDVPIEACDQFSGHLCFERHRNNDDHHGRNGDDLRDARHQPAKGLGPTEQVIVGLKSLVGQSLLPVGRPRLLEEVQLFCKGVELIVEQAIVRLLLEGDEPIDPDDWELSQHADQRSGEDDDHEFCPKGDADSQHVGTHDDEAVGDMHDVAADHASQQAQLTAV